ncbi:hypothetical protein C8Q73DRAFT_786150 [Cubamyces lactineus]|nr:hypothetical protein C8Q73DRAFT_786150 [Cubamyces lactineus]
MNHCTYTIHFSFVPMQSPLLSPVPVMSVTELVQEPEPDADVPTAESNIPKQPHNRLATKHTSCPCNIDPRCQLAVAFQEAREYWASHPDDVANGPNEIHESIEKWLVAKRILEGPPQITLKDETGDLTSGGPPEPISPSKTSGSWLTRLRFRRLSLPYRASTTAKSFTMSSTNLLRRRHTDSESGANESSSSSSMSVLPTSPTKKLFRNVALILTPGRHKKATRRRAYSEASNSSAYESLTSSRSSGAEVTLDVAEVLGTVSTSAGSIYEDAIECRVSPVPPLKPNALCPANPRASIPSGSEEQEAEVPVDPAYAALMPILYELEAMHELPRCKAVAAEHNDEDYMQFWETFSQLSAKEILSAVYAIRAGVLDAPISCDGGAASTGAVVLCAFWGFSASVIALYLYFF